MDEVNRRARNLFAISAAIILYLLAGVDLEQLSALGIRAPAQYPDVAKGAAVLALLWFWWRYWIVWMKGNARVLFAQAFRSDFRTTNAFQREFVRTEDAIIAGEAARNQYNADRRQTKKIEVGAKLVAVEIDEQERNTAEVKSVVLEVGDARQRLKKSQSITWSEAVDVPLWLTFKSGLWVFLRRIFRHEDFANVMLPHLIAVIALSLAVCKFAGGEPAGFYGWMESGRMPATQSEPKRKVRI